METTKRKSNLGVLDRPDGSALLSEDETTVIAGAYGPVEVKNNKVLIDKATVEAHYRPKTGLPGVKDRLQESIIRNIVETSIVASLYPRSAIEVMIQEMQDGGKLLACAVNAACLAILDSRIDMKFMFGAVTCFLNQEGELHVNVPIDKSNNKANFTFVFDHLEERTLASHTEGCFNTDQYEKALYICRHESRGLFQFFKNSLDLR